MAAAKRRAREPDPPEALALLERSLETEGLARGYVLRGEERYFRERALESIVRRAQAAGYEVCAHDAQKGNADFRLSALTDDLAGGGLFASQRLVVVRNPEEPLKKVGGDPSPLTRVLSTFVADEGNPGTVVLSGASIRADHAAVKAIKKADGVLFSARKLWDSPPPWNPDPRQAELVQWVARRAREVGVRLDPSQAVYVCAATGNDLFALEDQLERLRSAPGEALRDVVGWDAVTAPWAVAENLVAGDLPRALAGIETLFSGGFSDKSGRRVVDSIALSSMLIGSLVRGVRQGASLSGELARGATGEAAAQAVGLSGRPAAVEAALARARSRSPEAWRSMLEDVADLERRAKSGVGVDASDFAWVSVRWARADGALESRP